MKGKPVNPEERVCCSCGWSGQIKDAVCEPGNLVRCPKCSQPVQREEPE
jgi:hypothetical protein